MSEKFKPTILIFIVIALLLGGVSFFLGWTMSSSKAKKEDLSTDKMVEYMVNTETITTDLISGGFIQIGFKIQTNSTDAKEELTKREFQVRNIALRLLSGMNETQVKSLDGMNKLENGMKEEINNLMQTGKVVQIYTTSKMIQ